ncbi:MAG: M48 family metallopeptidase, partial [Rickettsiales bacterium]
PEALRFGGQDFPVKISRHPRAKRISLRYDAHRRTICLTLPKRAPLRSAMTFLHEKKSWLADQINKHPQPVAFEAGAMIPVFGVPHKLEHIEASRGEVRCENGVLSIPAPAGLLAVRTERWLKAKARETILEAAAPMAEKLEARFKRISVRDTSSRWGSCSRDGNLSFCWRLIFAPRDMLIYVVAHEVAHLKAMHHGPEFWAEVAKIYPDYERARKWLHEHAGELQRYG